MHPSTNVIFRAMDDGAVLVHVPGNRIFELNATGAHIWTRVAEGDPPDRIVSSLVDTFDVDSATARQEVTRLLGELQAEGLVTP
jgi:hypothetical protein